MSSNAAIYKPYSIRDKVALITGASARRLPVLATTHQS